MHNDEIKLSVGGNVKFNKISRHRPSSRGGRYRSRLEIIIRVYDKDDLCIREKTFNLYSNDYKGIAWLMSFFQWAIGSGYSIEIEEMNADQGIQGNSTQDHLQQSEKGIAGD